MGEIKLKARAKINLGLDVIRRKEDGYHEVRMVMQTVEIYDELTIRKTAESGIHIKTNQNNIPTDGRNLIFKAAKLMMDTYHLEEGVAIRLKKVIPVAAGMAGGSADAAAAFVGINQLFRLGLQEEELRKLAVKIGADVPYCIMGGTALAEGIGEILTPLPAPPKCFLVIAKPNIYISTKYVYENLHVDKLRTHPDIDALIAGIKEQDLIKVTFAMENVLETVTAKEHPVILELKDKLEQSGAMKALMSGSGPTVFGIFQTKDAAEKAYREIGKTKLAKQIFMTSFANQQ